MQGSVRKNAIKIYVSLYFQKLLFTWLRYIGVDCLHPFQGPQLRESRRQRCHIQSTTRYLHVINVLVFAYIQRIYTNAIAFTDLVYLANKLSVYCCSFNMNMVRI